MNHGAPGQIGPQAHALLSAPTRCFEYLFLSLRLGGTIDMLFFPTAPMPWFPWLLAPSQHEMLTARDELERRQGAQETRFPSRPASPATPDESTDEHRTSCDYCQHAPPPYQDYPEQPSSSHPTHPRDPDIIDDPTGYAHEGHTPCPPVSPVQEKRAEIARLTAQIDVLEAATLPDAEEVRQLRLRPKLRVWARRSTQPDAGWLWRMFERDRRL